VIITKEQFLEKESFYCDEIKKGKIFVYPTDTIYGIGCDAANAKAIKKIREIKQRDEKPLSIIVPNKKWIIDNCIINGEKYLDRLPGKFTLILRLRKNVGIAINELTRGLETIGIRIPDSWFAGFLSRHKIAFVTTSANVSGKEPIKSIGELKEEISEKVDYTIDDGVLNSRPSTLIDLSKDKVIISKR
jgi:L-threonylcarbamoyladenylate synthase